MVRSLLCIALLLPFFLLAGEFTASISRKEIHANENFILTLTLKDASPKDNPSIRPLENSFTINSEQHSSNFTLLNGRMSSSTVWKIGLTSAHEGNIVIPSINIQTSEGVLTTQPIAVTVMKENPGSSNVPHQKDLALVGDVSKKKPYKNEPFFYNVKLVSTLEFANIKMPKLQIPDAIVELSNEPKVYHKIIEGRITNLVDFNYVITPLKSGVLTIPPVILQGNIPAKRQTRGSSLFDEDFDPMSMFHGFVRMEPFTLKSQELQIDVQPAVAGLSPWLPANSLTIEEQWDDHQLLQVGEPMLRSFKITAEGMLSSQLLSLGDLQVGDSNFKIYADKPEINDEINENSIRSSLKGQYTLIPQQAGDLTLPEITIAWWDVTKEAKVMTRLSARTIHILPASYNGQDRIALLDDNKLSESGHHTEVRQKDVLLYVLLGSLALLLAGAVFWVMALQRRIAKMSKMPSTMPANNKIEKVRPKLLQAVQKEKQAKEIKDKKEKLPDLNPT